MNISHIISSTFWDSGVTSLGIFLADERECPLFSISWGGFSEGSFVYLVLGKQKYSLASCTQLQWIFFLNIRFPRFWSALDLLTGGNLPLPLIWELLLRVNLWTLLQLNILWVSFLPTFGRKMSGDERDLKNILGSFVLKLVLVPLCIWRGFVVRFWLFASFGNCWNVRSHIVSIIFYSFLFNSLRNILDTQQDSWIWFKTELAMAPPAWGSPSALRVLRGGCYTSFPSADRSGLWMVSPQYTERPHSI